MWKYPWTPQLAVSIEIELAGSEYSDFEGKEWNFQDFIINLTDWQVDKDSNSRIFSTCLPRQMLVKMKNASHANALER
jgi:hypothetical protein